ncbi:MAG TPA: lysophospholipid acyltransferase family protein [Candidatus Bathyarchaeia archaeon]|nr:lysophospholipid acyltransferase family protein [Candidatus Bathyarchaeia archaeon]
MRKLRDWICTVPFLVAFGLLMVLFDPVLRIASLFGKRADAYACGVLQAGLVWILHICGIRVDVERSPHVKSRTTYIVVSNHQSMFDIPIFGYQLFSNLPRYIAKVELAGWIPSVSFELRHGGHAIINRKDRANAVKIIEQLGSDLLRYGFSAVIFPEGTRARRGALAQFKPAGTVALLTQAPGVPVVPVCIDNSWRIFEHSMMPVPFGIRIRCWIGDPIPRKENEDPYALVAEAESQIRAAMSRFRGDQKRAA